MGNCGFERRFGSAEIFDLIEGEVKNVALN